jgi:predicted  nucleic acid-binding Zn-ribbon protein
VTAGSTSANSIKSFKSAFEQQVASPQHSRDSPDMEHLKRKLSAAKRPETGNRDMIRELNMYKQNNVALQKQIESLMNKLNQSKKNERSLTTALEEVRTIASNLLPLVNEYEETSVGWQSETFTYLDRVW